MKTYLVGGAVRDHLLGLKAKDLDYVVVGSTPEEMLELGYSQVGADFPVFLHPDTNEEYALARTEVKDGVGYQGFNCAFGPDVTLEDDLLRRDLTINAMAMDIETGEIIDPFGGQRDLLAGLLRPTSDHFTEDPVRILRAARFLARYPHLSSSMELFDVKQQMTDTMAFAHLTPERVWAELEKTLWEKHPSRFFQFLNGTGIFPEIEALQDVQEHNKWHSEYDVFTHIMMGIDFAADQGYDPEVVFGVLCHDLGKPEAYALSEGLKSTRHEQLGVPIVKSFCERLRAPNAYSSLALKACEYHTHIHLAFEMKPKTIHKLFKNLGKHFCNVLSVATSDKRGRGLPAAGWVYTQPEYLTDCYCEMHTIKSSDISGPMLEAGKDGKAIGEAIRVAEIKAIAAVDKEEYVKPYTDCMSEYYKSMEK